MKVALPLALPGLTAAAIFTWVLSWNDVFAAAVLTLRNPDAAGAHPDGLADTGLAALAVRGRRS